MTSDSGLSCSCFGACHPQRRCHLAQMGENVAHGYRLGDVGDDQMLGVDFTQAFQRKGQSSAVTQQTLLAVCAL